mgnify:CR=1 FL=1
MKLRYLFSVVLSSVLLLAGCSMDEPAGSFDNIKLSQTYLSIPTTGGTATVTVTATEEWAFVEDDTWPNVITRDKDTKEITKSEPAWLAVDKMSGAAGETVLTFSAEASDAGREFELQIKAGNNTQFIRIRQGSMAAVSATCKDVIAGPDGKTYRVKGVCTSIVQTVYGNWYLNDGTGEVYVYGTLDKDGATKNFSSWGLEVGDEIEVEGPKLTYGSTVELVDVTVIKINKSLVKVTTEPQHVAKEGGEFEVKVAYKGNGAFYSIPDDIQSWVSVSDMTYKAGTPTKIEQNPADTAIVKIAVLPNAGGDRSAKITFSSENADGSSSVDYEFTQEGSILDATIPEFLAAAEDATQYRVVGNIKSISLSPDYHNANVTIVDPLGNELYLYRLVATESNIEDLPLTEGDQLTVVGKRSSYKGSPQMAQGCYIESYVHYTPATIEQFLAAEVSDVVYRVTGKIVNIKEISASYKNATLTIADEKGNELYIYRMKAAVGGKAIEEIGLAEGDILTVVGQRAEYKGSPQMGNGYYQGHEKGSSNEGGDSAESFASNVTFAGVSAAFTDNVLNVNGVENVANLKLGSSKAYGEGTVTLPAGTTKVTFWSVAWKGAPSKLELSVGGVALGTQEVAANDGATNVSPYNITVTDSDKYTVTLPTALANETVVTVKTVETGKRAFIFGVIAE